MRKMKRGIGSVHWPVCWRRWGGVFQCLSTPSSLAFKPETPVLLTSAFSPPPATPNQALPLFFPKMCTTSPHPCPGVQAPLCLCASLLPHLSAHFTCHIFTAFTSINPSDFGSNAPSSGKPSVSPPSPSQVLL